jgi:Peptidase A4 family
MKSVQSLRHGYVRIPLLFLLVISPVAIVVSARSATAETSATCTPLKLASEMGSESNIVSSTTVQNFASQSLEYLSAVSGYNSTFTGSNNDWSINPADCTVSWHDAAANFLLKKDGHDYYILTITVNPGLGLIYDVTRHGYSTASGIPVSAVKFQGGYYVANASTPTSATVTYGAAYWTEPALHTGTSNCITTGHDSVSQCLVDVWSGLQNNTYDGYLPWLGTNVLVQGGIQGNYTCTSSTCYTTYDAFTEYWYNGQIPAGDQNFCGASVPVAAGNHIYTQVGSNAQFGLSGSDYFVDVINEYNNYACSKEYSIAGAPHYADTVVENPDNGDYTLANFTTVTFTDLEMGTGTGTKFDQYPNYLNDWGMGTYMDDNCGVTSTSSMTEPMYYSYGTFTETYTSSIRTGC